MYQNSDSVLIVFPSKCVCRLCIGRLLSQHSIVFSFRLHINEFRLLASFATKQGLSLGSSCATRVSGKNLFAIKPTNELRAARIIDTEVSHQANAEIVDLSRHVRARPGAPRLRSPPPK
ncbi:hypothetical protein EVAR_26690_1 [Eumeta japonica]|uniref:Uncharacterized protein n=1 Tax=Eumeta variegata TaxID=151549 RepID=A0A4C1VMM5_EUMVA|nr:hypothetical protein EVAR_26690_1 [Eumeta japonica]